MNNSGALNVSKLSYISRLPQSWVPKTQLIQQTITKEELNKAFFALDTNFPIILKPDRGERGKEVSLIKDFDQLVQKVKASRYNALLCKLIAITHKKPVFFFIASLIKSRGELVRLRPKSFVS